MGGLEMRRKRAGLWGIILMVGLVLLAGLSGVVLLSASGRGADGLLWLILSLWLLPLILVTVFHATSDREEDR